MSCYEKLKVICIKTVINMYECKDVIQNTLESLYEVCEDHVHYMSSIPEVQISGKSWPLVFYRDYVSKSQPVVIKNGCKHFSATSKWGIPYFMKNYGDKRLQVDITPNGYADAVTAVDSKFTKDEKMFLIAEEREMLMSEFLSTLQCPKDNYVCYIQSQNSNLTNSLYEFTDDIEPEIDWASEALNKKPDAVNFWMGDGRAVTSMHKDPYENIYCVIDGYKDFALVSPTDLPYIPYKEFGCANYVQVGPTGFDIEPQVDHSTERECRRISWIDIDPLHPDLKQHPDFAKAHVYQVRVSKGDCLYLPALWFHHVKQSHAAIAVNYWYDMEFDVKYCYNSMLQTLSMYNNKMTNKTS